MFQSIKNIGLFIILIVVSGCCCIQKNNSNMDMQITTPIKHDTVTSPLIIEGKAKMRWFFEGEIDIEIVDANGNVLKEWYGTADKNAMRVAMDSTHENKYEIMIPFHAKIVFERSTQKHAELVFYRLSEREERTEYRLPIRIH